MEFVIITRENLDRYSSVIDADAAEHIGRSCYAALAAHSSEEKTAAVLIWKWGNCINDRADFAHLTWFWAVDVVSGRAILQKFEELCSPKQVENVTFELKENTGDSEREALVEAGFECHIGESRDLVVTVADFQALPISAKADAGSGIRSVGMLTLNQMRKAVEHCMYRKQTGLLPDLGKLPLSWFEPDLSCCVQMDGRICGLLLVHTQSSGSLDVELLYASEPAGKQDLLQMIRHGIISLINRYPEDTTVLIRRCTDATHVLTDKLFPGKKGPDVWIGQKKIHGDTENMQEKKG